MSPSHASTTARQGIRTRAGALCLLLWLVSALQPVQLAAQNLPGAGRSLLSAPAFLPVEEAFTYFTSLPEPGVIGVHWQIVDGHYLYRDKFQFSLMVAATEIPLLPRLPAGSAHEDEFFGAVEVYFTDMAVMLPMPEGVTSGAVTLLIEYQGCAEAGLCYTLQHLEIDLEL